MRRVTLLAVGAALVAVTLTPPAEARHCRGFDSSHSRFHRRQEREHRRFHERFGGPFLDGHGFIFDHSDFHRQLQAEHRDFHRRDFFRDRDRDRDCR